MPDILTVEIKRDLEYMYKITGDILNFLEDKNYENRNKEVHDLLEMIKFRLEDIGGILQKDIFNCDYLLTKKLIGSMEEKHKS